MTAVTMNSVSTCCTCHWRQRQALLRSLTPREISPNRRKYPSVEDYGCILCCQGVQSRLKRGFEAKGWLEHPAHSRQADQLLSHVTEPAHKISDSEDSREDFLNLRRAATMRVEPAEGNGRSACRRDQLRDHQSVDGYTRSCMHQSSHIGRQCFEHAWSLGRPNIRRASPDVRVL